jgi:hypothetical protein
MSLAYTCWAWGHMGPGIWSESLLLRVEVTLLFFIHRLNFFFTHLSSIIFLDIF